MFELCSRYSAGVPIRMVWDGGAIGENYWSALKGGPNAQKFIVLVNRAEIAAALAQLSRPEPKSAKGPASRPDSANQHKPRQRSEDGPDRLCMFYGEASGQ